MPPIKFWNLDAWKCYFQHFPDSIWALRTIKIETILTIFYVYYNRSFPQTLARTPFLPLAKAWDLVLWKCPRHSTRPFDHVDLLQRFYQKVNTFKTPEMCLYQDWAGCFTIIFAESFRYFKPVSGWILFCENVAGVPRPFNQFPSRVEKVDTFKTPAMRLYFDSDVWGGCLTIIFVVFFLF